MIKLLVSFAFVLMLASIGLLIFGIMNDKPMITVAMPLLWVGMSLLTVANAQNAQEQEEVNHHAG